MENLEAIRTAHVIDEHLGRLAPAVPDEVLKKKVLAVQAEWRELAYVITAHLCGVESDALPGSSRKKKASRKRDEDPAEQAGPGDGHGSLVSEGGAE